MKKFLSTLAAAMMICSAASAATFTAAEVAQRSPSALAPGDLVSITNGYVICTERYGNNRVRYVIEADGLIYFVWAKNSTPESFDLVDVTAPFDGIDHAVINLRDMFAPVTVTKAQ